jgi:quinol monooxygenase YgiN
MGAEVSWMLELDINLGREEDFRTVIAEMVASAKANEPGTLIYEASLSADGMRCHIYERYADSAAALTHLGTFGNKFAARFMDVFTPVHFIVYGSPDEAVRGAIAGLNPVYMESVSGFAR